MALEAEQQEKLSMLIAVAGDTVDAELAKVMLESADWDVERALNGLLEDEAPARNDDALVEPVMPSERSQGNSVGGEATELSIEDLRALLDAYDVDHTMCSEKADLVSLLDKTVGAQATPSPEPQLPEPQFPFPMTSMPQIFQDMYSEPSTRASSRDSQDFPEKWKGRIEIICKKYPTIPRSQVIGLFKECSGAACVVDDRLQEMIRVKEEKERQNADRKAEIDIQNQEYYESLLMDQQQEIQRKEAEQEKQKQEEEMQRKQAEDAEAARAADAALEVKRSRVNEAEPDKAHPDRCQIVIRTPSGKRLTRTFLGTDDISFIYDWIDVTCAEDDFVKESYKLVARLPGKPNQEVSKSQESLKDEGIEHQSVFMISCS
jgi:hypothetical protein